MPQPHLPSARLNPVGPARNGARSSRLLRSAAALGLALLALTLLLWPQMGSAQSLPPERAEILRTHADKLHPTLLRQLLDDQLPEADFTPIIVEWKRDTERVLSSALLAQETNEPSGVDAVQRRAQVIAFLQADADANSGALRTEIDQAAFDGLAREVTSFWASPIVALEARPALIERLAQRADVVQIRPDARFRLDAEPFVEAPTPNGPDAAQALLWNLQMVGVDLAESALGLDGTGTVVAIMDTGVDWQHPVLTAQYRGYNPKGPAIHAGNWYAATNEPYVYPGDGNGHGTHVAGTIVGDDHHGIRTGMAPGAKWIAVKIFDNFGNTQESWIHEGFQWLIAPNGDPSLAPDVVNSSWGSSNGYDDLFRPDVQALRAAGILPVFSAGNSGPRLETVSSPASFPESFAVGAVDQERYTAIFSSRGPSFWKEVKPEIAAPGVTIYSSYLGGGFAYSDGTSMAAPHVTGLVALLRQGDPSLNPDQLEAIIMGTATPLGSEIPNNQTGWGLINAYAAGLRVTQSGEIKGQVVRSVGGRVAYPTITATPRSGEKAVTVLGDASGAFTVALRPGLYDVSASAFGFVSTTVYAQMVQTGTQTVVPISLTLQPVGTIFGRVTEVGNGVPLAASITVVGTPVQTTSDSNNGTFSLALPGGTWTLRFESQGHRIVTQTVTVTPGQGLAVDPLLPAAPKILLVDSGRWYYSSRASYFKASLEELAYPVTVHTVRNPYGALEIPIDVPTLDQMRAYDLVIWSAPLDSPSYIDAATIVQEYLTSGGRLLLTGEDIAYWDGGGSLVNIANYFPNVLGMWYQQEDAVSTLDGVRGTPLDGVTAPLNTREIPTRQNSPDSVVFQNPKTAHPLMTWPDGSIGAATSGVCQPFRAAWLGFGLEGTEQDAKRTEILDRLIPWFQAPPAEQGILLANAPSPAVGFGGDTVSHSFTADSTGVQAGVYDIEIQGVQEGEMWPISLRVEQSDAPPVTIGPGTPLNLPGCARINMTAQVVLPSDLKRDEKGLHVIRMTNRAVPTITAVVTLTSKSPAPILLVDDERFYDNEDRYRQALSEMPVGYDLFTATNSDSPSLETLYRYPAVIWFTGYDWFQPLTLSEQKQLATYLETGGRLLLSSQDLLDTYGSNEFVEEYLGVRQPLWTITSTDVAPTTDSPLGADIGPFLLTYPIPNWSDGLLLTEKARPSLEDQQGLIAGALTQGERWRTAFFAFPLESMAPDDLRLLLGRTLTWLGPFSGSRIAVPAHVGPGDRIPISLTVSTQEVTPQVGATIRLPLPGQVNLVPNSLQGGWRYDGPSRSLIWEGTVHPDAPRILQAEVDLLPDLPARTRLVFAARMEAGNSFVASTEAHTLVNSPWLVVSKQVWPPESSSGETLAYTVTLANQGVMPSQSTLLDAIPAEVQVISSTIQASTGTTKLTISEEEGTVLAWQSEVAPGGQAVLTFSAQITHTISGSPIRNRAVVTELSGQRHADAATVIMPKPFYLPLIAR